MPRSASISRRAINVEAGSSAFESVPVKARLKEVPAGAAAEAAAPPVADGEASPAPDSPKIVSLDSFRKK